MLLASEDWAQLRHLAEQHRASRETRELRLESRQMGYSLQQLLSGLPELDQPAQQLFDELDEPGLALGWALAARAWQIEPADALAAWLWGWLENQLAVLMKTLPLGQQAAQRLTSELLPLLDQAQRQASALEPQHWGSAAFGLASAARRARAATVLQVRSGSRASVVPDRASTVRSSMSRPAQKAAKVGMSWVFRDPRDPAGTAFSARAGSGESPNCTTNIRERPCLAIAGRTYGGTVPRSSPTIRAPCRWDSSVRTA